MEREKIDFDVLFVGAGPASLAGAIQLMLLAKENKMTLEVAVIEKGANVGAHAVSGAVLNPVALAELIPDHMKRGCPVETTVTEDALYFLNRRRAFRLPFPPKPMRNKGCYIVSLSKFTRWLADIAEELGVNIFPGFAGKTVIYGPDQRTIVGVRTGDKGIGKDGRPKGNFEPGIDLMAKVTVFGEGARGSLMKDVAQKLNIYADKMPPVYETGIKEVIQLPETNFFSTGKVNDIHFMGYPLDLNLAGGGFIYSMGNHRISIGFLTGLSYQNPLLDPHEEFQKFKKHPFVATIIQDGKVIEQGARAVSSGGFFTLPKLAVNGGLFIGGSASFQNMQALKGIHISMKSGMLAAKSIVHAMEKDRFTHAVLAYYQTVFEDSWAYQEMIQSRNFSQALAKPGLLKLIYIGAQYLSQGHGIRDLMPHHEDRSTLKRIKRVSQETEGGFDKTDLDGVLYVDKLTGVYLSKTQHREDEPNHIIIHNTNRCIRECYPLFGSPCTRFCPGKVYEITGKKTGEGIQLKLNPSNCFHCKTCDIKDPYGNITWTCPEGGGGPGYKIV